MLDTVPRAIPKFRSTGFKVAAVRTLCMGICVDNIYTMVCTGSDAVAMAICLEDMLDKNPMGRIPQGAVHTTSDPDSKRVEETAVFGHTISSSGCARPDWLCTRAAMGEPLFGPALAKRPAGAPSTPSAASSDELCYRCSSSLTHGGLSHRPFCPRWAACSAG